MFCILCGIEVCAHHTSQGPQGGSPYPRVVSSSSADIFSTFLYSSNGYESKHSEKVTFLILHAIRVEMYQKVQNNGYGNHSIEVEEKLPLLGTLVKYWKMSNLKLITAKNFKNAQIIQSVAETTVTLFLFGLLLILSKCKR